MFHESRLVNWAKVHAKGVSSKQRYLYGNQAYGVSIAIILPNKGNFLNPAEERTSYSVSTEPQSNGASVRYLCNGINSETSSINGQV